MLVDGFVVASAMAADAEDPLLDDAQDLTTADSFREAQRRWAGAWRRYVNQLQDPGWAALIVVAEPAAEELFNAVEALSVPRKKQRKRGLDQAIFGYLPSSRRSSPS